MDSREISTHKSKKESAKETWNKINVVWSIRGGVSGVRWSGVSGLAGVSGVNRPESPALGRSLRSTRPESPG